ncbi:phospholipase A and acyltransferase 4-like [Diretmus argenteus]
MDLWKNFLSQITETQVDKNLSTAEIGDLIEFTYPSAGVSCWGVYVGDGHVIHFGVADEDMMLTICRGFLQQMIQNAAGDRLLRRTKIRRQHISEIKVPRGTRIKVNNNKHHLRASPEDVVKHRCATFLDQEFAYDLLNFNSEHFATFVRSGHAVCNQIPFKKKNEEHVATTQTLERIMQQRMETEI